jgi:hypothetical protein
LRFYNKGHSSYLRNFRSYLLEDFEELCQFQNCRSIFKGLDVFDIVSIHKPKIKVFVNKLNTSRLRSDVAPTVKTSSKYGAPCPGF